MKWPWTRRRPALAAGNGHAAKEVHANAVQALAEAKARSREVDRLAGELRRALGVHR